MNNTNLIFKKTCACSPEQYDVYYHDKHVDNSVDNVNNFVGMGSEIIICQM